MNIWQITLAFAPNDPHATIEEADGKNLA